MRPVRRVGEGLRLQAKGVALSQGEAGSRVVTGVDPDGIVTELDVTSGSPSITRTAFTPATVSPEGLRSAVLELRGDWK